jgi:thiol-disulfide isomerase/thioredoxin
MALACVMLGCGAKQSGEATAPLAKTVEVPVAAEATPSISGTLRAHNGSALRAGEITVRRDGFIEVIAKQSLDRDGSFRVELEPGLYMLSIGAVDHAQIVRFVVLDRELRVSGTLGTYDRTKPGDTLALVGKFLDREGEALGAAPTSAIRIEEGVYRVDLSGAPKGATRLRYQLRLGGGRTANGPLADSYESDGGGDFWSVVELADRNELVLDMRSVPSSRRDSSLVWKGEDESVVALREITSSWQQQLRELDNELPRKDGKVPIPTPEYETRKDRLIDAARERVDSTDNPELRTLLRAAHLMQFAAHMKVERAREELTWFVEHVPVDAPALLVVHGLESAFFHPMKDAEIDFLAAPEAWLERFAQECREPGPALEALTLLLHFADQRGDEARVQRFYARATEPHFVGTYYHQRLSQQYDPARTLQRGKPLPDFDFAMLGEPSKRVTKAEREGRLYLIEFWATWCGPCVVEMPLLHEAYAAINGVRRKGKGETGLRTLKPARDPQVEFVFVSFDSTEKDVEDFRRKHWSMPWTHAYVGQGDRDDEVMKRFGFSGVPTTILVDRTGTILEYGAALRHGALKGTLERVLASQAR